MPQYRIAPGALVLYKTHPARVTAEDDKVEIELEGAKSKRVRPKDVIVLHPGPLRSLGELTPLAGGVEEAWELLQGAETHLTELAELVYGEFTPAAAWAAWRLLEQGEYFAGDPDSIRARSPEEIAEERRQRAAKLAAENAWTGLMERLKAGRMEEQDRPRLMEVEQLALGRSEHSRILQGLQHAETPENGHRLLCGLGYWPTEFNLHPLRFGAPRDDPQLALAAEPEPPRLDLTHLAAYAIDDEESHDPDDAVSLEGDRIWVHVADVASLAPVDSDADREARARGANLYLPERIVHMLPLAVTEELGLGLQAESPALSFAFRVGEEGTVVDFSVHLSRIRVTRHSYAEINERLHEEPFAGLARIAARYRERRFANGAANIDLPEVSVRVRDGQVVIRPLGRSDSRQLVSELMLMAGEGVAGYAVAHGIPIPFATQEGPDAPVRPQGFAESYACRRQLKPSRIKVTPEPHAGVGLERYTRATSPLRRYLDLVVHQQLRAHLLGRELLSEAAIGERVAQSEPGGALIRRTERISNTHWKLVYLQRHSHWQGEAVVVEAVEKRITVLIPELALEARVRAPDRIAVGAGVRLKLREVDLPELMPWFRVVA